MLELWAAQITTNYTDNVYICLHACIILGINKSGTEQGLVRLFAFTYRLTDYFSLLIRFAILLVANRGM